MNLQYKIAGLRVKHAIMRCALALKAGFDPDQPRDERGRWGDGHGGAQGDRPKRDTGDPKIDRTTEILVETATDVANGVKNLKGAAFGIAVHYQFAQSVRNLNLPGIGRDGVEQSFSTGDTVRYGLDGSVRTDVVKRDGHTADAPVMAVWDLKTGNSKLSQSRVDEIRNELKIDDSIPIIEIHVDKGVVIKSLKSCF